MRGLPQIFDVLFWVDIKRLLNYWSINVDCEFMANWKPATQSTLWGNFLV